MHIRRLSPWDRAAVAAHYARLSDRDRRMRFCGNVSQTFAAAYCARLNWARAAVLGAYDRDRLCGVAELVGLPDVWPAEAELAISVAAGDRRRGVGRALLGHALAVARNRYIGSVRLYCLPENRAMQGLAHGFDATIIVSGGEARGEILTPWPSYASLVDEAATEAQTLFQAAFDLTPRPWDGRTVPQPDGAAVAPQAGVFT